MLCIPSILQPARSGLVSVDTCRFPLECGGMGLQRRMSIHTCLMTAKMSGQGRSRQTARHSNSCRGEGLQRALRKVGASKSMLSSIRNQDQDWAFSGTDAGIALTQGCCALRKSWLLHAPRIPSPIADRLQRLIGLMPARGTILIGSTVLASHAKIGC